MAKKFVRGITDIKNIEHQDFDTNNVNDLLSDGKHNYIHRKKNDGSEEYHNLTNNLKTLQSDDTDLLTVTNYNNTNNSATLRPKHDVQKEQVLESTDETIVITHGENGTEETTNVDVNPTKVLEHDNLLTGYGISKTTSGDTTSLGVEFTRVDNGYDLNNLVNGRVKANNFVNAPLENTLFFVTGWTEGSYSVQEAFTMTLQPSNKSYKRIKSGGVWYGWNEQITSKLEINEMLSHKQNTLTSNSSIGLVGTGLMQLYSHQMSYSNANEGALNTYAKTVLKDTSLTANPKLEYHFTAKIKPTVSSITITLNNNDTTYFTSVLNNYGQTSASGKTAMINGLVFSLTGSDLTISRDSNSTYNQVVSFCDIIEPAQNVE